ncbi:hypothetical protein BH23CHL2_BH23CHL2_15620 [soil metagenome]
MMTNCKMVIERLYPYLDRELSATEVEEIHEHLRRCPPCAKYFDFEAGMLRIVGDACRSVEAPPDLRAKIFSAYSKSLES